MKNLYPNNTQHDMSSSLGSLPEIGEHVVADDPDLLTWEDVARCHLEPIPKNDAVLAAETGSSGGRMLSSC